MKKQVLSFIALLSLFLGSYAQTFAANGIFTNYATWYNSTTKNTSDTIYNLVELITTDVQTNPPSLGYSFVDLNGDGLTDFIYKGNYSFNTNGGTVSYITQRYVVFMNNGDMTYNPFYKCVAEMNQNTQVMKYYGSCAQ